MTKRDLFAEAMAVEVNDPPTALKLYTELLTEDSDHVSANVNIGTLYYNADRMGKAETHYRRALKINPKHIIALFDLGNVLDETGRVQEAVQTYKNALQLAPTYADAHYNLALAYEKLRKPYLALVHWKRYIALDRSSEWADHARSQIKRYCVKTGIKIARAHSKPRRTKRRAKLALV